MKTIFIFGNDKISASALVELSLGKSEQVYIDKSTNLSRIFRLFLKRSLSLRLIILMAWCEFFRDGGKPDCTIPSISSNNELLKVLNDQRPDQVVLYRAGLIISKEALKTGVRFVNLHAAKLPEFGGIGAIAKALKKGAFVQSATLHIVTTRIDSGQVLMTEPYKLDRGLSYCQNEAVAYGAANKLLSAYLVKN